MREDGPAEGVFAVDPAIQGELRTPPEAERVGGAEPVGEAERVGGAEPVGEPEPVGESEPVGAPTSPSSQAEPAARPRLARRVLALAGLIAAIAACAAVGIVFGSVVSSTGDREAPVTTATVPIEPRLAPPRAVKRVPQVVSLAPGAAFDPLGDRDEHSGLVPLALDGDPSTAWSSEDYRALNKAGVGFYVDLERPVSPTRLTLRTPTPGFALAVYGAKGTRAPRSLAGWTRLGAKTNVRRTTSLALTGDRYRRLLLWITALPPGGGAIKVSELRLRA
jgi:eukaryotic-like serine/threonine-protein kinase